MPEQVAAEQVGPTRALNAASSRPVRQRLATRFLFLAVPVICLSAVLFTVGLTVLHWQELRELRRSLVREHVERTAWALRGPVWHLDQTAIANILELSVRMQRIRCARVDDRGAGILKAIEYGDCVADLRFDRISHDIVSTKEQGAKVIGRLDVLVDTAIDAGSVLQTVRPLSGMLIVLIAVLIGCVLFAFRRTISAPLARVADSMRIYRETGERRSVDWQSNDELGVMIRAYNANLRQQEETETRLQLTQEQLIISEKMAATGQLTAGVAHEINNPTNFAYGAAQNLKVKLSEFHRFLRELAGDEAAPEVLAAIERRIVELDEQLATILEGNRRVARIVQDLRIFSRLDEAERKPISVASSLQSTLNLVETQYRHAVRFETDFPVLPDLLCNPARLNQVFMNLIVNACHAIGEKRSRQDGAVEGVLRVSTRLLEVDSAIEVAFTDNGCGIPEAVRKHLFEPFFTTKPVGEGTGLGLSVSWGIVKEHGGHIEVASVPGEGSTFTVVLPLAGANRDGVQESG